MPLNPSPKSKRIIFLVAIIALLGFALLLLKGSFSGQKIFPEEQLSKPKTVEIDFSVFDLPQLKELQPLEAIPVLEKEKGRENPFLPLGTAIPTAP